MSPPRPGNGTRYAAERRYADELAQMWMQAGLNYYLTVSFDERTHRSYGLNRSDRLIAFVKHQLERADYLGPYAIAVHDNRGSAYFHAHILLVEDGNIGRIRRAFFRHGDLDRHTNGPVRGPDVFFYCANRACENGPDSDYWDSRLRWRRRSRPRGKGGKRPEGSTDQDPPYM